MKSSLRFTLFVSGCLLLYRMFPLFIDTYIDSFLTVLGILCLMLVFLFLFFRNIVYLWKEKDYKPLLVQIILVLLFMYFPFSEIRLAFHEKKRMEVVRMIQNGTYKPNITDWNNAIKLPKRYTFVALYGIVHIEQKGEETSVLFIEGAGLDDFYGYVYVPGDTPPSKGDFMNLDYIEKIDEHWYAVGAY